MNKTDKLSNILFILLCGIFGMMLSLLLIVLYLTNCEFPHSIEIVVNYVLSITGFIIGMIFGIINLKDKENGNR